MKSIKFLGAIALSLLILFSYSSATSAASNVSFWAKGLGYPAYDNLTKLEGTIATVYVEADKKGAAGIEQNIRIKTDTGDVLLEIINWYSDWGGGAIVYVGIVAYKDNEYWFGKRVLAEMRRIYNYKVEIIDGTIYSIIWDESNGEILVSDESECGAQYIERTDSYIEYWRHDIPGSFYYYGFVTIKNTDKLYFKENKVYKSKGLPFGFYIFHRNWDGITDKGEVDDRFGGD